MAQDTRATVMALYDAYEQGDLQRVAAFIHDDVDWVIYAPVSVFPFAGPRRGRHAVMTALAGIAEAYALLKYAREIVMVDGDRAAVLTDASYRQHSSGRTLRFRVASFLRFAGGQLIEFREFTDTFDLVEQTLGRELAF